jgi:beta-glucosidase
LVIVAGADVAQIYLGDPARAGEPPRQLVGFKRVYLQPGKSARVEFKITPRDTWWWAQTAGGWTQSPGEYHVYVGDSSSLANLPLHGSFAITQTAAARQVIVDAPREFVPGQAGQVSVRLTRSGNATLPQVRLALQLPQGWTATSAGPTSFTNVSPTQSPQVTFKVTPPSWAPVTSVTIHATANLASDAQREDGVTSNVVAQAS